MTTSTTHGDIEGAADVEAETHRRIEHPQGGANPIAIKAALNLLGHEVGGLRLPLVDATRDEVARQVRDCLERLGLLLPLAV